MEPEEPTVQAQLGTLVMSIMDQAADHGVAKMHVAGIVMLAELENGEDACLTRTTVTTSPGSLRMWMHAIDLGLAQFEKNVAKKLLVAQARISELEERLGDEGSV